MKKIFTIIALLALYTSLATAQLVKKYTPELMLKLYNEQGVKNVFEGEVIKKESYHHPEEEDMIFTSNLVKVNRVFKGGLKPGEIVDLVSSGGELFHPGQKMPYLSSGRSGDASFNVGFKGAFVCWEINTSISLSNPNTLQYRRIRLFFESMGEYDYGQGYLVDGPAVTMYDDGTFLTRESFYAYLKKIDGVTIPSSGYDPEFDKTIFENRKKWVEPNELKAAPASTEPIDTQAIYRRTEEYLRLQRIRIDSIHSACRSKKKNNTTKIDCR